MNDRLEFQEAFFPISRAAAEADPSNEMRRLCRRVTALERSLAQEKAQAQENARRLLLGIVELYDAVMAAVQTYGLKADIQERAIVQDLVAIGRQVRALLAAHGVQPIHTLDRLADEKTCEIVGELSTDIVPPRTVVQERRLGYTLHDNVLRRAQVIVSCPPEPEPIPPSEGEAADDDATGIQTS